MAHVARRLCGWCRANGQDSNSCFGFEPSFLPYENLSISSASEKNQFWNIAKGVVLTNWHWTGHEM